MRVIKSFALATVSAALLSLAAFQGSPDTTLAQSAPPATPAADVEPSAGPATTAAPPTTAAPSTTAAPAPAVGLSTETAGDLDDVYDKKLHGIEERVNGLKEDVFRSKARLLLLRETVLHGVVSGARAILYHVNELGSEYVIESVTYFLDGSKIFSRADNTGELARKKEIKFFDGGLPAGNHQVVANVVLRGNGFGIFSYLNQYQLKVQGSYSFIAQEGKVTRLRIICYERGGLRQDFTDRPYFRYEVQTDRNLPSDE